MPGRPQRSHSPRAGVGLAVARSHNRKAIHSSAGREGEQSINPSVSGSATVGAARPAEKATDALGTRYSCTVGGGNNEELIQKMGSDRPPPLTHFPHPPQGARNRAFFSIGKSATQHLPSGDFLIKLWAKTRGGNFTLRHSDAPIQTGPGKWGGGFYKVGAERLKAEVEIA